MSFLDGLNTFFESSAEANASTAACTSDIDHYKLYQFSLIPSVVISIALAVTIQRKEKLMNVMDGRPGLLTPMNALTRSSRLSYAAAFGSTSMLVYKIVIDRTFAIDYEGPIALKTLIAILSMIVYGTVYFPIFASLALGTALSYILGALLVWMFTVVDFYNVLECDYTDTGRAVTIIRHLPSLLCHTYLSISLPYRCFKAFRSSLYVNPEDRDDEAMTIQDVKDSYQGKHVRNLLKKPVIKNPPEGICNKISAGVMGFLHNWIYHIQSGFRYPSRILSVMVTAGIVVYVITVEFLVWFTSLLDIVLDDLGEQLDYIGWDSDPGEPKELTDYRDGILIAHHIADVTRSCLIVSTVLASCLSFLSILHMLTNFRTNLYAMYRGDYRHIPSPDEKSAASLCVGSIKYAGYQVAYIIWSFIVVFLVLFLVSMILAGLISLLIAGYTDWLVNKVLQVWPGVVVTMVVLVGQMLLARKVFLQGDGQYLRLNNRRFFFVFTYFMFFYNIFLGLVSCLLRILKAMLVGILFLARLDNSTLPRKFEFFDPGFSAYQGFIHMETAHTHPVVIVFIKLLQVMHKERQEEGDMEMKKKEEEGGGDSMAAMEAGGVHRHSNGIQMTDIQLDPNPKQAKRTNFGARFNWWVTYTLLQNPQIRIYRKGYVQALRKARREGIRLPISDLPVSEFDLVKMEMEKERERERLAEEAKKRKCKDKDKDSKDNPPSYCTVSAIMFEKTTNIDDDDGDDDNGNDGGGAKAANHSNNGDGSGFGSKVNSEYKV